MVNTLCHGDFVDVSPKLSKIIINPLSAVSIISLVIIEKYVHWLAEDYVISCYNHPARGDYNTEALISKWPPRDFWCFWRKEKRKYICSDNHLSNYTKTIILLKLSQYCGIIPSLRLGDYSTTFTSPIIVKQWQASNFSLQYHYLIKHTGHEN